MASSGFWMVVSKKMDRKTDSTKLLIGLAHHQIVTLGLTYINRGSITQDEFDSLHRFLHEPYKGLGGNGTADKIMADVTRLPIRSREEMAENDLKRRYDD